MNKPKPLPRRDATANPPAVLQPFLEVLGRHREPLSIDDLNRELAKLSISTESLGDSIQIDTGAYVRTLVFEKPHVEVLVMAWLPGQRSPIHDHAGSACAVRVVSGCAIEQFFSKRPDGMVVPTGTRSHEPGSVACSVDKDIHSMGNAVTGPASPKDILVTIHVYSPPLAPTRKYTEAPLDRKAG